MVGCDLCEKIWDNIDEYQGQFRYLSDEKIGIVMKDRNPWLYIPVDPPHYSDAYVQINFCPKCGRQVNLAYKVTR